MRIFFFAYVLPTVISLLLGCQGAVAALGVDITKGNTEKVKISVAPMHSSTNLEKEIGKSCIRVMLRDLNSTGIFDASWKLPAGGFGTTSEGMPDSNAWTSVAKDVLVTGSIKEFAQGRVKVKLFIWDVASGRQLSGKSFNFATGNWRRAAHSMSDSIYSRITGEGGYFNTRIAYVAETGLPGSRRIAIMDQDGANNIYITGRGEFVSTPRFSPDARNLVYMSYAKSGGSVVLHDLETGYSTALGGVRGVNSSPRFSPDGRHVLLSESAQGSTNIYSIDLKSGKSTRLTNDRSINTSASYSPDKKSIVFNSDRSGRPQLYVMNADGTNQRRISSGKGGYSAPAWSPRGDWIAFTKTEGKSFHVGVMKPDGSGERLLAKGYMVDSPSWSPNGRVILFTQQDPPSATHPFRSRLVTVDITGTNTQILDVPTNASNAHWSPVLRE
ncbi:Tol-Pal system beta propeller repeat protein TolB [Anaplasma marginale]|uniref:Tol-Pal system protein TolB n=1 Tax=Anaplasma marginale (strain Florida) TaxID=320483 RepID=B9KHU7_ANAMF|nr:Tol-Pal system beta propeller repeat protein TolB [Anaplasma marginale]ACM49059.1 TOLB protein precursor (tolB) [Anaplasma marginale str. Florida]